MSGEFTCIVVDDEHLPREYLRKLIPEISPAWRVEACLADGEDAYAYYLEHPVDLIITDIVMPAMNGLELCGAVKQRNPRQQIAIVTGFSEFSYARQAMQYGIVDYIIKPLKVEAMEELLSAMEERIGAERARESEWKRLVHREEQYDRYLAGSYLRALALHQIQEAELVLPQLNEASLSALEAAPGSLLAVQWDFAPDRQSPSPEEPPTAQDLYQLAQRAVGPSTWVFLDDGERLVFYGADHLGELWDRLAGQAPEGVRLTGGLAAGATGVGEIRSLYLHSLDLLLQHVASGTGRLYQESGGGAVETGRRVQSSAEELALALREGDAYRVQASAKDFASAIPVGDSGLWERCFTLLVKHILQLSPGPAGPDPATGMEQIRSLLGNAGDPGEAVLKALPLLLSLAAGAPGGGLPGGEGGGIVMRAQAYIYHHFTEPITLEQVAGSIDVTPTYLSRVFHESTGETYIRFITRLRMEYAANLLKQRSSKVSDIAEKVGYYDLKTFANAFKRYYGETPSQYRLNNP